MRTYWMSCYKIGCKLFNIIFMTLHDRMKKNKFAYGFVDSTSLACKIWALESDWQTLLIYNPDHRNAKQVFIAIILLRKTQSTKMCYLNKQIFCVSYTDVVRQSKKWGKYVLNGKSGTTPSLKGVSTHGSIDNFDEESKSTLLYFEKL